MTKPPSTSCITSPRNTPIARSGAGKEAYNVKVGGMGTPLTGDESRKSWPSTYKVRDKKH